MRVSGVPIFFTFCLTDCKPYESMTGPMGQRVLSYLLSGVTSQKPMLFRTLLVLLFTPGFPLFSFGGLHRFGKLGDPTYPLMNIPGESKDLSIFTSDFGLLLIFTYPQT